MLTRVDNGFRVKIHLQFIEINGLQADMLISVGQSLIPMKQGYWYALRTLAKSIDGEPRSLFLEAMC